MTQFYMCRDCGEMIEKDDDSRYESIDEDCICGNTDPKYNAKI